MYYRVLSCIVVLPSVGGCLFGVAQVRIVTSRNVAHTTQLTTASHVAATMAPTASHVAADDDDDGACSDDDDDPMLACMPNPEALARLVKYADSLPGAAALIAAASQHVERTVLEVQPPPTWPPGAVSSGDALGTSRSAAQPSSDVGRAEWCRP